MSNPCLPPGNYKPASLCFCAQRGGSQAELSGDHGEPLRRVIVYSDANRGGRVILHGAPYVY
jgi:hypothetical protein